MNDRVGQAGGSDRQLEQGRTWTPARPQAFADTAGIRMRAPFTKATSGPLPGTKAAGNALADVMGGIRGSINASDWGRARTSKTVPVDYGEALPRLLAGGADNDKFLKALESIPIVQAKREAERTMQALGAKDLDKTVRRVKEYLREGNTVDDLIRNTEDLNAPATPLNELADKLRQNAADLGVDMPEIADIGYFPHVLSTEFKDLLATGGEDVQRFLDQSGIISKELLGDGGFLQGRKLRPRNGKPLTITLPSGRSVDIVEGTVAEINAKMKELFPQMKGTALETDPRTALERYITSVSREVGDRAAGQARSAAGSQFVRQLPGQQQLAEGIEGPVAGRAAPQTVARGVDPFANDEFLRGVKDQDLTQWANEMEAASLGRQVEQETAAAQALRTQAAGDISATGRQVQRGLDEGLAAVDQRLPDELIPLQTRQADLATSRADLDIADEFAAIVARQRTSDDSLVSPRARRTFSADRVATRREIATINANAKQTGRRPQGVPQARQCPHRRIPASIQQADRRGAGCVACRSRS